VYLKGMMEAGKLDVKDSEPVEQKCVWKVCAEAWKVGDCVTQRKLWSNKPSDKHGIHDESSRSQRRLQSVIGMEQLVERWRRSYMKEWLKYLNSSVKPVWNNYVAGSDRAMGNLRREPGCGKRAVACWKCDGRKVGMWKGWAEPDVTMLRMMLTCNDLSVCELS